MPRIIVLSGLLLAAWFVLPPNAFSDDEVQSPAIIGGKIWSGSDTLNPAVKGADDTLQSSKPASMGPMFSGEIVELPPQSISENAKALNLKLSIPKNLKFIKDAPILLVGKSSDPDVIEIGNGTGIDPKKGFTFPITAHTGKADLLLFCSVVCCTAGPDSACFFKQAKLKVPVTVGESDNDTIEIHHRIDD